MRSRYKAVTKSKLIYSFSTPIGRSISGIVGSNTVGGHRGLSVVIVVSFILMSLRRVEYSSRGVLPSGVCLSMISKPQQERDLDPQVLSSHKQEPLSVTNHTGAESYISFNNCYELCSINCVCW